MNAVDVNDQSQIVAMESKRRLIRRKKMPKNAGQKKLNNPFINKKMINWNGEEISLYELLMELERLVCDPVQNLRQMDGDMYMSDYQRLTEAEWRILSVLRSIEGDK